VRLVGRALPYAAVLALTGCTGLFHSNAVPEQTYYLRAPPVAAPGSGAMRASLRVGHVTAGPGLDTPHIMLVQADHRMNFYTGARWPAPATEVIEALIVETMRGSGQWSSVEDSTSPFPSDYFIQVVVRRFEADYTQSATAPAVQVILDCTIGRREGRDVVGSFVASGSATAEANRQGAVVDAFEQATRTALTALAQQAAQAAGADLQRRCSTANRNSCVPDP
jgi:cholesterol transport system auxiliary component